MDHKCQTYGQQFEGALACQSPEQAESWMEKEVIHLVEMHGKSPIEAVKIIKANIGYMAGYYDHETAQKIHRLFGAVHPIFGASTYFKDLSPEQAFNMGQKLANELKDAK